jgi:flagellar FliL protein
MAKTATKPAPAESADAQKAAGGKKKLLLLAAVVVALVAGWFFFLGPGAGKDEAVAKEPEPGEVLELEPITMNLADGRLLKVGLSLQFVVPDGAAHGEPSGSQALDEAISFLGAHTYDQLVVPATREAAKAELSKRVSDRYHHEVMAVYFTEFVMQ